MYIQPRTSSLLDSMPPKGIVYRSQIRPITPPSSFVISEDSFDLSLTCSHQIPPQQPTARPRKSRLDRAHEVFEMGLGRMDSEDGLKYFTLALEFYSDSNHMGGVAQSIINISLTYSNFHQLLYALQFARIAHQMASEYLKQHEDTADVTPKISTWPFTAILNYSKLQFRAGSYSKALRCCLDLHERLPVYSSTTTLELHIENQSLMGMIYARQVDYEKAVFHLREAYNLCCEFNFPSLKFACMWELAETYNRFGRVKKCFEWFDKAHKYAHAVNFDAECLTRRLNSLHVEVDSSLKHLNNLHIDIEILLDVRLLGRSVDLVSELRRQDSKSISKDVLNEVLAIELTKLASMLPLNNQSEVDEYETLANVYNDMAWLYLQQDDVQKGFQFQESSLFIATKLRDNNLKCKNYAQVSDYLLESFDRSNDIVDRLTDFDGFGIEDYHPEYHTMTHYRSPFKSLAKVGHLLEKQLKCAIEVMNAFEILRAYIGFARMCRLAIDELQTCANNSEIHRVWFVSGMRESKCLEKAFENVNTRAWQRCLLFFKEKIEHQLILTAGVCVKCDLQPESPPQVCGHRIVEEMMFSPEWIR